MMPTIRNKPDDESSFKNSSPSKQKKDEKKDPFLILGEGLYVYRSFLRTTMFLFFQLSIISMPIAYIYATGGSMKDLSVYTPLAWSLGNMGTVEN
jgi:hypothetical protein